VPVSTFIKDKDGKKEAVVVSADEVHTFSNPLPLVTIVYPFCYIPVTLL
jgi:hypothetical protein